MKSLRKLGMLARFQMYFVLVALTAGMVLLKEIQYLMGNRSWPESPSVLEPETISPSKYTHIPLRLCNCVYVARCKTQ